MICRRRFPRNPLLLILASCVVLFIVFFHLNYEFPDGKSDSELTQQQFEEEFQKNFKELQRLKSLDADNEKNNKISDNDKEENRRIRIEREENEEMMRKLNESLKLQEEENDPFKPAEKVEYFDFINFKVDFIDTVYTPESLIPVVTDLNKREIVYNEERYTSLPDNFPVIVVQVHKRIEYFRELLDSLQKTRGIENVVLIVSHDYYSDIMNELIRQIKFCKVIQIFFPYSLQLYPNEYPGQSKNDCPRDIKKRDAIERGCLNAQHPDKYGHYREAHITMTKHHWWWKINMAFDHLSATKHHNGPFIFIEEDHYVAPSFYEALMALHDVKNTDPRCKDSCDILTMGTYNNKENFQFDGGKILHGNWISAQHNMGMALYRTTWKKLRKHANKFCTYDDYNWDWTLLYMSKSVLPRQLSVLVYDVPRLFHVGDCGLHHTKDCLNAKATLIKVKGLLERNKDFLFTDKVNVFESNTAVPIPKPNGGWGDARDHELCERFVKVDSNLLKKR